MLRTQNLLWLLLLVRVTSLSMYYSHCVCVCVCVCLSVSVLDIVCYYFHPYIRFFSALLAQSLASNRKRTKLFLYFPVRFLVSQYFFFFFFNLMVNEALVFSSTGTHTRAHTYAHKNINSIHSSL